MRAWKWSAALLFLSSSLWACADDESSSTETVGSGGSGGVASVGGGGTASQGGSGGAGEGGGEAGGGGAATAQESEPNDGATETEYNDLAVGTVMAGAIGTAGDSDVFRLPTTGALPYEATLETSGSSLVPHLTVLDDGRDGDAAGGDYVKIVRAASGEVRIQWMAMGSGGYFLAVRDARNVDGQSLGDDTFTYTLTATAVDVASVTAGPLPTASQSGSLAFAGAIDVYTFAGTAGQDALIDMQSAELDGRLYIVADATSDWIARQDDRGLGDPNPLIDAPLTASGDMMLVVESIAETPASLGYTLSATIQ